MHNFSPLTALVGGGLIGVAASIFLLVHGRICGISGLFGGLVRRTRDVPWLRVSFIGGLLAGGVSLRLIAPSVFEASWNPSWMLAIPAGLLVGFGTQLGNGCTSGHGVCGLGRLSVRSLVATGVFMLAGFATVFAVRHLIGGSP
jgi:uncharacterized membrane protein YedE/YeeE